MKPATFDEGQTAFDRFKRAMKTIVTVPKESVVGPKKSKRKRTIGRAKA